jgi:hypothetical protein
MAVIQDSWCILSFSFPSMLHLTGSRFVAKSNRLIYQLKTQTVLKVGHEWTIKSAEIGGRSKAKLNYGIRVTCNENYFGEQCTVSCRSRDDDHGHYVCNEKGERVCLPGWKSTEDYCKTRKLTLILQSKTFASKCNIWKAVTVILFAVKSTSEKIIHWKWESLTRI